MAPHARFGPVDLGPVDLDDEDEVVPDGDVEMTDAGTTAAPSSEKLIVAVDFGTTFSSVAYARVKRTSEQAFLHLDDIKCISNYADDPGIERHHDWVLREEVPTALWYNTEAPRLRKSLRGSKNSPDTEIMAEIVNDSEGSGSAAPSDSDGDDDEPIGVVSDAPVRPGVGHSTASFWGYSVMKQIEDADVPAETFARLECFKLLLSKDDKTQELRDELIPPIQKLKSSKIIKKQEDLITHYLEHLFRHARAELMRIGEYDGELEIEFVLCVPAVWPSKACRAMQEAMTRAVKVSGLGTVHNNSLDNLFIVSEPEAAAACVLAEDKYDILEDGETIVIIDAGGGTVDVVTYKVETARPLRLLRLAEEVVEPGTELAGGSYVNRNFEALLTKRLMGEKYLEDNDKTLESIIKSKVAKFENDKRKIDINDSSLTPLKVTIDYLRANSKKRFMKNKLEVSKKELQKVFEGPLSKTETLLRHQLEKAKAQKYSVQKVILIGGFGRSPSLKSRLETLVKSERNYFGEEIQLLQPRIPSTVVARGAVLQAINKVHGIKRKTLCSYGFLRDEQYDPSEILAHSNIPPDIDPADGELYIRNTIDWLIQKGDDLEPHGEIKVDAKHTFKLNDSLLCREVLYVSDRKQERHFRRKHGNNSNAEKVGSIVADMNFLREEGHIQPQMPSDTSTFVGKKVKPFWVVNFDLVMIIDGRNLRYEARWPPSDSVAIEEQEIITKGQISIAAAFRPGTV